MENSIVCELVWKEAISKKGSKYYGLFAIFPNGNEMLVSVNKVVLYTALKYSK